LSLAKQPGTDPNSAAEAAENLERIGLGLAIAERAVHVHRGTIRAIIAPGGGLIVEIDLPMA
jgi:K+-sensing histidine kinase KdpD